MGSYGKCNMAITRRNTLVLLFVVVAAAGVIGGTGAFSSVEADRTVSVQTASDSDANVQFDVDPDDKFDTLEDGGGDTIALDFEDINLDANTTYEGALNVTVNTGAAGSYDLSVTDTPDDISVEFAEDSSTDLDDVSPGNSKQVDVIINTEGITQNSTSVDDGDITFRVDRS